MAEKEGAIVNKGHEEGLKFGTPMGLLPLADVIEVGFVKSTGYMWIQQNKKVEHKFNMISKLAKELMLWPLVNEITVDDPPTGKIHFKSLAGITKTFPVEAFAAWCN
ncbi:unnamed protein product [Withania somnifera]